MLQYEMQQDVQAARPVLNPLASISRRSASAAMDRLTIMVIAPDPFFRAALCWTLLGRRPDSDINEVGCVSAAAEILRTESPTLVVLDGDLPAGRALEALKGLRAHYSGAIVLISPESSDRVASRVMDHGAGGFISRSTSLDDMAAMLCKFVERAARNRVTPRQPVADPSDVDSTLTPAQARVLALMEAGQLNKQIAHNMGIAESTVKAHVSAIFRKLNVQNRVQATLAALQQRTAPAGSPSTYRSAMRRWSSSTSS